MQCQHRIGFVHQSPIMADHKKYGFSGVVAKPYRIEEMKKVLDEVLGKGK